MLPRLCYESIPLLVSIHLPIMMQYNAIGMKYSNTDVNRWIDVNGWTDVNRWIDGTGGQMEWVDRWNGWTDGMGGQT